MPGEKDPTQAISTCPFCNSCVDEKTKFCENCKQVITPHMGKPHPRKVPQKGERYDSYGPKLDFVNKGVPIAASKQAGRKTKNKDHAEHDDTTVKDEYLSDEISMCVDPRRINKENVDIKKEEIMRSCRDLAIDG